MNPSHCTQYPGYFIYKTLLHLFNRSKIKDNMLSLDDLKVMVGQSKQITIL